MAGPSSPYTPVTISATALHHHRGLSFEEIDGPMLKHGLQKMHGQSLTVPLTHKQRPDPERLATRFQRFVETQSS